MKERKKKQYMEKVTLLLMHETAVVKDYHHLELDQVNDDKLIFIIAHRIKNLGEPN